MKDLRARWVFTWDAVHSDAGSTAVCVFVGVSDRDGCCSGRGLRHLPVATHRQTPDAGDG